MVWCCTKTLNQDVSSFRRIENKAFPLAFPVKGTNNAVFHCYKMSIVSKCLSLTVK